MPFNVKVTHVLTEGCHKATLISAPNARIPLRLQSATAVCLLAPDDRYSTDTGLVPILIRSVLWYCEE